MKELDTDAALKKFEHRHGARSYALRGGSGGSSSSSHWEQADPGTSSQGQREVDRSSADVPDPDGHSANSREDGWGIWSSKFFS